jgi:aspartate dehydrogenase
LSVVAGTRTLNVGLIGYGAIGAVLGRELAQGAVQGIRLVGVLESRRAPAALRVTFEELLARSDLVIEAASQTALASYGPAVKAAGRDLLALSIGALADDVLLRSLTTRAGGRLLLSSGACGAIDILRAANTLAQLESVSLKSVKPAAAVVRDWMPAELVAALSLAGEPVCAFRGSARDAVRLFPESANIAGLLALATVGFEAVRVEIWGEANRRRARHELHATGAAGEYRVSIENNLAADNPRTSAITAFAVLRALSDVTGWTIVGC